MINDMQFVYDTLMKQYYENHMVIYGRSLGSGFATKLASENSPRYLILDAPYYSLLKSPHAVLAQLKNVLLPSV